MTIRGVFACGLIASLSPGCGAAPSPTRVLWESVDAARRVAPAWVLQAEQARDESNVARAAGRLDVADDLETISRLWIRAARTEAERDQLQRAREHDEDEALAADRRAFELEEENESRRQSRVREAAAAVARDEMERALERAAADERAPRRRGRTSETDLVSTLRAADALVARARFELAAAVALVPRSPHIEAAENAIAGYPVSSVPPRSMQQAQERLEHADQILHLADAALASAREQNAAPTEAEIGSLLDEARALGFECERQVRGVVLQFGSEVPLRLPELRVWSARLASLLRTHRGPVAIEASGTPRSSERVARPFIAVLTERGVDPSRFLPPITTTTHAATTHRLQLVLLAYGAPSGE